MTQVKQFTVVLRGPSGAYWPPGKSFTVGTFPSASGPVKIVLATRRETTPRFTKPSPRGIHVEVTGNSGSLEDALTHFSAAAELLVPVVCLVANAPIGLLEVELGFESTPGALRRDFFQQFLLDERVMPLEPHTVPNAALKEVMERLPVHPDTERLHRAMAYYHQALMIWRPGAELAVLSYLYMGVETMTPVLLRRLLADQGIDRQQLIQRWGIQLKDLDPEVRRRLIFLNDDATYKAAKSASDGLEHGFAPFTQIRTQAEAALLPTARYLRLSILAQLQLSDQNLAVLRGAPYEKPFYLHYTKFIRGVLLTPSDDIAAADQLYPILRWKSTRNEALSEADADPRVTYEESIHLRAASSVKFESARIYVIGPGERGAMDIPIDGTEPPFAADGGLTP